MKHIFLLTLFLGAGPAGAIENLECEYALATPREVEIVPGHQITLSPGQILIRGQLDAFRLRRTGSVVHFAVRDEMAGRGVLKPDEQGLFTLNPGDTVYLLDNERRQVLLETHYDQFSEDRTWIENDVEHAIKAGTPVFTLKPGDLTVRLTVAQVDRLFNGREPVVVVRTLSEAGFAHARATYLPAIRAFEAHQNSPDRFFRLNADETFELAHYEVAHTGDFLFRIQSLMSREVRLADGRTLPPMTVYELHLLLVKPDGSRLKLEQGQTIVLFGANDRILMKYTLREEKIIMYPPYDAFERELCGMMLFVDRAVIVMPK